MDKKNNTQVIEFILKGFSTDSNLQIYLFGIFSLIYALTFMGNMMIIATVTSEPKLHSPMYQFLRSLSLTEIFYISVTVPRMLRDLLQQKRTISFIGCAVQLYFFCFLGTTECFTLAFMAYDRYVAICYPLHYTSIMTKAKCLQLLAGSWLSGILLSSGQISYMFSLPFCNANIIDHFFCDILPVVKLACADTFANELAILLYSSLVIPLPFLLILVSYIQIIFSVLKVPSADGRRKAFSTCGSHLTSVTLFYGSATITYLRTKTNNTNGGAKIWSLLYVVFIPMLNPIIYSLRNKEIKNAITKTI
ncbi:olfactory receptor 10A7-like, partial [Pelobates fuscus]|uniref:olfactory receptor 10A7-like n=1 Tax=Pelobates fuscus TaxID=191477 RepID=UPI002FE49E6B